MNTAQAKAGIEYPVLGLDDKDIDETFAAIQRDIKRAAFDSFEQRLPGLLAKLPTDYDDHFKLASWLAKEVNKMMWDVTGISSSQVYSMTEEAVERVASPRKKRSRNNTRNTKSEGLSEILGHKPAGKIREFAPGRPIRIIAGSAS